MTDFKAAEKPSNAFLVFATTSRWVEVRDTEDDHIILLVPPAEAAELRDKISEVLAALPPPFR